jgi:hypothetical protein
MGLALVVWVGLSFHQRSRPARHCPLAGNLCRPAGRRAYLGGIQGQQGHRQVVHRWLLRPQAVHAEADILEGLPPPLRAAPRLAKVQQRGQQAPAGWQVAMAMSSISDRRLVGSTGMLP